MSVAEFDASVKALDQLAKETLEYAKSKGADNAKVSSSVSISKKLVVEATDFTLAHSIANESIGILVHKDKKKGSAGVNSRDGAVCRKAVDDALMLAKFSVEDEFLNMPDKKIAGPATKLPFLFDDRLVDYPLEKVQDSMREILKVLMHDPRLNLERLAMDLTVSHGSLRNSRGMFNTESQTMLSWQFMGLGKDGEEVTGFDYDGDFSYSLDGYLDKALRQAETFREKILSQLNPIQCPSYRGKILLSPRAVEEILLEFISYHVAGSAVMDGKSAWTNSIGKKIMNENISIFDDPHTKSLSGACSYDSDGIPTGKKILIQKGVLQTHVHDCYSAKKVGVTPNGMAGGPFGIFVTPGSVSKDEMLKGSGRILLVDRFSGNMDEIKGDFSGVAKSSRLFEKGKDKGSVTETMIAGNLFEILNGVLQASREVEIVSGQLSCPYILLDQVSVTGQG